MYFKAKQTRFSSPPCLLSLSFSFKLSNLLCCLILSPNQRATGDRDRRRFAPRSPEYTVSRFELRIVNYSFLILHFFCERVVSGSIETNKKEKTRIFSRFLVWEIAERQCEERRKEIFAESSKYAEIPLSLNYLCHGPPTRFIFFFLFLLKFPDEKLLNFVEKPGEKEFLNMCACEMGFNFSKVRVCWFDKSWLAFNFLLVSLIFNLEPLHVNQSSILWKFGFLNLIWHCLSLKVFSLKFPFHLLMLLRKPRRKIIDSS